MKNHIHGCNGAEVSDPHKKKTRMPILVIIGATFSGRVTSEYRTWHKAVSTANLSLNMMRAILYMLGSVVPVLHEHCTKRCIGGT